MKLTKKERDLIIQECLAYAFDYKADARRGAIKIRDVRIILEEFAKGHLTQEDEE